MAAVKSDQIDADTGTVVSSAYEVSALRRAENEGIHSVSRDSGSTGPDVFDRVAAYLRKEYACLKKDPDLTLEELLATLVAATDGDRRLRKQFAPLKRLMAWDIKDGVDYPIPGLCPAIARPMRAWRQRYNGLGHFLSRPS